MTNQSGETRRVFRAFWAWHDDEEERWLAEMARQGWHLIRGGILFTFRRGEAKEVLYRLDFRAHENLDRGEYLRLFQDAGWEHVCVFGPWHYFRADAAAGVSDIYSDPHSLIGKYRRMLRILALFGAANMIGLANNLMPDHFHTDVIGLIGIVCPFLAILLVGYVITRLWMRIAKLERAAL
jgi:hypothetical protein